MTQGVFSKEEVEETKSAVLEMFDALTKRKQPDFLGHLNDILLFLEAAKRVAPNENLTDGGTQWV